MASHGERPGRRARGGRGTMPSYRNREPRPPTAPAPRLAAAAACAPGSLYDDAVATMDLEQVNHFERVGRPPHRVQPLPHRQHGRRGPLPHDRGPRRSGTTSGAGGVRSGHPRPRQGAQRRRDGPISGSAITSSSRSYMQTVFPAGGGVAGVPRPLRADPGGDRPSLPRPGRQHLQRPGGRARRGSPCSTRPSAGSTSTACATWVRSNWPCGLVGLGTDPLLTPRSPGTGHGRATPGRPSHSPHIFLMDRTLR